MYLWRLWDPWSRVRRDLCAVYRGVNSSDRLPHTPGRRVLFRGCSLYFIRLCSFYAFWFITSPMCFMFCLFFSLFCPFSFVSARFCIGRSAFVARCCFFHVGICWMRNGLGWARTRNKKRKKELCEGVARITHRPLLFSFIFYFCRPVWLLKV